VQQEAVPRFAATNAALAEALDLYAKTGSKFVNHRSFYTCCSLTDYCGLPVGAANARQNLV